MFKVGDRVKVVDIGSFTVGLTIDKEYVVEGIRGGAGAIVCVLDDTGVINNYLPKRFEKVEDNMEKTFREVIRDIKDGEVWESELKLIKCVDGDLKIINKMGEHPIFNFDKKTKYTLQRKQYTFAEAFKAYEEGKEIESCDDKKYKHELRNGVPYYKSNNIDWIKYVCEGELFSINEIRGKWYINN